MVNKIAVIGDKDSVLAFKAVGVEVFDATTAQEAQSLLKKLSHGGYAVIFVAENLAEQIPEVFLQLVERRNNVILYGCSSENM